MFGALGRLIARIWSTLALIVASLVRRVGHGARDLDPAHRRDGVALLLVAVAVVVASAVWWSTDGPVAAVVGALVMGALGSLGWLTPLLLVVAAVRLMRHPDDEADNGRLLIGSIALTCAIAGLWHIAHGSATPSDGAEAMRAGGGWLGWLVTSPVAAAVGAVVTSLLLLLVLVFGLLV